MDGGSGNDTLFANLYASPAFNGWLTAILRNANWTNVERYDLTLTAGNDVVRVTDFGTNLLRLNGGPGTDLLFVDRTGLGGIGQYELVNRLGGFELLYFKGSEESDIVTGTKGNDTLMGMGGNDQINGVSGNDYISGGEGDDSFVNIDLNDTVYGGAGNDSAVLDLSQLTEGITLRQGQVIANISGIENYGATFTAYDDIFYAKALRLRSFGGDGLDRLILDYSSTPWVNGISVSIGTPNSQSLIVGANVYGSWVQIGGWEVLQFIGTIHADSAIGGALSDVLYGGDGNDQLLGLGGADRVYGGAGNDTITADRLDVVYGDSGDDRIVLTEFGALVYGGTGFDTILANFSSSQSQGIYFSTAQGAGRIYDFERFEIGMSAGNDTLAVDCESFNLSGGAGTDDVILMDFSDASRFLRVVQYGVGSGALLNVYVTGSATPYDSSVWEFERSRFIGSVGNDAYFGQEGNDTIYGRAGDDWLSGNEGDDLLAGEEGNDSLLAGNGKDSILGGGGNDWILAQGGNDLIYGQAGNDMMGGDDGDDLIYGGSGLDIITGDQGNDQLYGQEEADQIYGGEGEDHIYGGLGEDWLDGSSGDDTLFGNEANDILLGGGGNDVLYGGGGRDEFYFDGANLSGQDVIMDYTRQEDSIWLESLVRKDITVRTVGADLVIEWANGQVTIAGMGGQVVELHFV